MLSQAIYRHRDALAMLPAAAFFLLLVGIPLQHALQPKDDPPPVMVSLAPEPEPEPAPPPQHVTPPPPVPKPVVAPARRAPAPTAPPVVPQAEVPMPAAQPAPPAPVATPPQPVTPPAPTTPPPPVANAAPEAAYVARLRAYLDSVKRYPTTREARSLRPQGRVHLWLELARDGSLRDAGIEQTSGSMILDSAALATVRQGTYPPFPADMWPGHERHRFAVTLEYTLDG